MILHGLLLYYRFACHRKVIRKECCGLLLQYNVNRLKTHRMHVLFDCCHIVACCRRMAQVPCSIAIFIKTTGSAFQFPVKLLSSCSMQFGRSIRQRRVHLWCQRLFSMSTIRQYIFRHCSYSNMYLECGFVAAGKML